MGGFEPRPLVVTMIKQRLSWAGLASTTRPPAMPLGYPFSSVIHTCIPAAFSAVMLLLTLAHACAVCRYPLVCM